MQLPLWNPLIFCGYPQWAEGQMALVGPLAPLLMLPINTAINLWLIVLHIMTAVAAVWWLSTLRLSPLTALAGGLSIALSSAFVLRITGGHPNIAGCYPWFFMMAGAWNCWWDGHGKKWLLLAAAGWSFVIWSCHVETAYHLMLWWCLFMLCGCGLMSRAAFWRWLGGTFFVVISGLLICSALLAPNTEFAALAERAKLNIYESSSYDFPAENLLTLLFPGCYGFGLSQTQGWRSIAYFGRWGNVWENTLLVNPLILGCLFLPWPRRHRRVLRGLAVASAICFVLALGRQTPVFQAAYHALPGISMFRCHGRLMAPVIFGIVAMACLFFDDYLRRGHLHGEKWHWCRFALAGGFIAGLLLMVLLLLARENAQGAAARLLGDISSAPSFGSSLELFPAVPAGYAFPYFNKALALHERLPVVINTMFAAVCGWLVLIPLAYLTAIAVKQRALPAVLLVAASIAVTSFPARLMISSWDPRESAAPQAIVDQVRDLAASGRVMQYGIGDRNGWMKENIRAASGYAALLARRQNTALALATNQPLDTAEYQSNTWDLAPAARWLGISALYGSDGESVPDASYPLAAHAGRHRVWKVRDPLPLAMWTDGGVAAASYEQAVSLFANPSAALSGRVILETGGKQIQSGTTTRPLEITRPRLAEILVHCDRITDGWVIVIESFLPGWKAFVDDQRVSIIPAQVAFQSVHVTGQCGNVRFKYQPASFRYGLFITLAMTGFMFWYGMSKGPEGRWHQRPRLMGARALRTPGRKKAVPSKLVKSPRRRR